MRYGLILLIFILPFSLQAETRKLQAANVKIKALAEATAKAKARVEKLLAQERARVRKLLQLRKKMGTMLH